MTTGGDVLARVAATGLLGAAGDGPLLLLCSAGRDSLTLLDVAVRLRGVGEVSVLHVDHGLRASAADDADHLRASCASLGVALTVAHAGPAPGPGEGNQHAWARGRRAALADAAADALANGEANRSPAVQPAGQNVIDLDEAASAEANRSPAVQPAGREVMDSGGAVESRPGAAVTIASAHTRSDLVETALARLATQPGRRALLAMRAEEQTAGGHRLVRPLLGVTREETMRHCLARELIWRDDPSNADARFSRARLRHGVMPVLRSLNPRAEEAMARTLAELAEEQEALTAIIRQILPSPAGAAAPAGPVTPADSRSPAGAASPAGAEGEAGLPLATLRELHPAIARLVLRTLCEDAAGRPCPQAGARLAEVLALEPAAARNGRAALDVGAGVRVELRRGLLRATNSQGPAAPH